MSVYFFRTAFWSPGATFVRKFAHNLFLLGVHRNNGFAGLLKKLDLLIYEDELIVSVWMTPALFAFSVRLHGVVHFAYSGETVRWH